MKRFVVVLTVLTGMGLLWNPIDLRVDAVVHDRAATVAKAHSGILCELEDRHVDRDQRAQNRQADRNPVEPSIHVTSQHPSFRPGANGKRFYFSGNEK